MTALAALIAKLEAATEGSRELDAEIHDLQPKPKVVVPLDYTRGLDAALTLVPEGWTAWELRSRGAKTRFSAEISRLEFKWIEMVSNGTSVTPALALCIAALRARMGK